VQAELERAGGAVEQAGGVGGSCPKYPSNIAKTWPKYAQNMVKFP
jgi:hypothetical protein